MLEWLSIKYKVVNVVNIKSSKTFSIDPYSRVFTNKFGKNIYLTAKEFDLLYFLYSHKGQVFTKDQLYDNVWGLDHIADTRNLTAFIRKLRLKVEPEPENPQYIITVWGVGYKFSEKII